MPLCSPQRIDWVTLLSLSRANYRDRWHGCPEPGSAHKSCSRLARLTAEGDSTAAKSSMCVCGRPSTPFAEVPGVCAA